MAKQTFYMTGIRATLPAGFEPEEAVRGLIDETGAPTYETVSDILADPNMKTEYIPSSTRQTVKVTVELIDEKEYMQ